MCSAVRGADVAVGQMAVIRLCGVMVPAVEQTQNVLWVGYVRIILISYLAFSISIFIQ